MMSADMGTFFLMVWVVLLATSAFSQTESDKQTQTGLASDSTIDEGYFIGADDVRLFYRSGLLRKIKKTLDHSRGVRYLLFVAGYAFKRQWSSSCAGDSSSTSARASTCEKRELAEIIDP
jgi:hypothetical protein